MNRNFKLGICEVTVSGILKYFMYCMFWTLVRKTLPLIFVKKLLILPGFIYFLIFLIYIILFTMLCSGSLTLEGNEPCQPAWRS